MPLAEQLDFPSLAFPKDRRVLYVSEVAARLSVTERHVIDLIEEGELQALSVGGAGMDTMRVPVDLGARLARRLRLDPAVVTEAIVACRREALPGVTRKTYRVPVESWEDFLDRRHSFKC